MQNIFSSHLYEVEQKVAPLLKEQARLERAVADRESEWFISDLPVKIGPITEVSTTNADGMVCLELAGQKLEWSWGSPGKSGYFYYQQVDPPQVMHWEFSATSASRIEDLAGKSLKEKFIGYGRPGSGGQAIDVSVGQVWLVRTVDDPGRVYILQLTGIGQDEERLTVRYGLIDP
jgi:hypothetical protein